VRRQFLSAPGPGGVYYAEIAGQAGLARPGVSGHELIIPRDTRVAIWPGPMRPQPYYLAQFA
jgi:hypothetical protein